MNREHSISYFVLPGTRRRRSGIYVLEGNLRKAYESEFLEGAEDIYMEPMRWDLLVRFYQEMERDVIRAIQRNQRNMAGRSGYGSRG